MSQATIDLIIQSGALGIVAIAVMRQSTIIGKMHDTLTKLTMILGRLEERGRD